MKIHVEDTENGRLTRDLAALVAIERASTAELLAYVGEADARGLDLNKAFPSMHAYGEAYFSEDAAAQYLRVARVAREFPELFHAIADGRLELSGVALLAPHLTPENAAELIEAAAHKSDPEIERMLMG